ncbi:PP0621 family protein [Hydromonas duriensis]|uniref:Uncharacterized protein n=1 Tax=Hydromonas duriensis TaxID=1527608 RepID=A0A4V3DJS6_9BURK|nr:PP0621 family protein [Hydromonas duriensis]TDR31306.1 hypothetical protein DFR44_11170 [Hydromonas duriensis]
MKFIVILVVCALIGYAMLQKWRSIPPQTKQMWAALFGIASALRQAKKQPRPNGSAPVRGTQQVSNGLMLPCARCGLHVLESEGVHSQGQFYCSTEHSK